MGSIRHLQPGEALPASHICRCYDCAQGKLPPDAPLELIEGLRGHFRVGSFPRCDRVEIDGEVSLYVVECQTRTREPWALLISEPIHRCQSCHGDRPCMHLIFPKRIDVEIYQRDLYEQVRARAIARGELEA